MDQQQFLDLRQEANSTSGDQERLRISENNPNQQQNIYIAGSARVQIGDQIYQRATQDQYGLTSDTQHDVNHLGIGMQRQTQQIDPRCYPALFKSLAFPRMSARLQTVSAAMARTCEWLFDHSEYHAWMDDGKMQLHHGFLWIKGKPGTGKSTLMKANLERTSRLYPQTIVLSHFFNARSQQELEKSLLGLYRSLAYQLLHSIARTRTLFLSKFYMKYQPLQNRVDEWSCAELESFLIDTVRDTEPIKLSIFIDALDEADVEEYANVGNLVRVCLTSRHYPHITFKTGLSLVLENQSQHVNDLKTYVQANLHIDDEEIAQHLRSTIEHKAGPIFLWAILVIRILNRMYDEGYEMQQLITHLEEIPSDLSDLYDELLFQRSQENQTTQLLFVWMLFTTRPLSPEELYAGVQIGLGSDSARNCPPPATLARFILNGSKGLLECVQASNDRQVVQFIHETVRDFLLKREGIGRLCPWLADNITGLANDQLKSYCLQQIQSISDDIQQIEKIFQMGWKGDACRDLSVQFYQTPPLLKYAVASLWQHANNAATLNVSQHDFLLLFNQPSSKLLLKWSKLIRVNPEDDVWAAVRKRWMAERNIEMLSLLYILITLRPYDWLETTRSDTILHALLEQGTDVNARGGNYGNALQVAVVFGKRDMVQHLITRGADLNAECGLYGSAFEAAMCFNDDAIVDLVAGSNARLSASTTGELLVLAMTRTNRKRLRYLLDRGLYLNKPLDTSLSGHAMRIPLTLAAELCPIDIVRMLLEAGVDVNGVDRHNENALMVAAANRKTELVKLLIEYGADPKTTNGKYSEVLHQAAEEGKTATVEPLLEHGQGSEAALTETSALLQVNKAANKLKGLIS